MLLNVLKEDVTVEFRQFGKITIPKGTLTGYNAATGDNPGYNFVCEYDWMDKLYPEIREKLKPDAVEYGINIPEDMLMSALRVRFIGGDSGYCRDIFYSDHTKQKYCRMEIQNGLVGWYSLTPDWEEPDCPLRTDMLIQVLAKDGKVAVTEQQTVKNGDYKTEKKFLFSWEKDINHELRECSTPIYREEKISYIIDREKGFNGSVVNTIGENGIVHYTSRLNFEEYKKQKDNENLIILNEEELNIEIDKYKRFHQKVFEEISYEEFYRLYEVLPPKRILKRNGAFSFFVEEEWNLSLHMFCFKSKGKYYKGLRDITLDDNELGRQINIHLKYFTLSMEELDKLSADYLYRHRDNGGTSEFDATINDISRATIHKLYEKYGKCFLGKYNLYDEDRKNLRAELVVYEGQPIYNFEFAFAVPENDEKLVELIREHNREKEVFNSKEVMEGIEKMTQRIAELKGTYLIWS